MDDPELVATLAIGAKDFFDTERSGRQTARQLKQVIDPVLERHRAENG